MAELAFGICGVAFGIGGLVFGIITNVRNKKLDDTSEGRQDGAILEKLNNIKETTEEIKHKLEKKDEQDMAMVQKVAELEASIKSAHKRIDGLEKYHQPN